MGANRDDAAVAIDGTGFRGTLRRTCFGDRVGEIAFVGAVVLFTGYWIAEWRINDSLTLLNAMDAMARGQLYFEEAVYGTSVDTPGVTVIGDRVYGRNYGILTVALLPLGVLRAVAFVADLRIVVAGAWSLGLLALAASVGHVIDRRRFGVTAGSAVALALFALNVALATDLDPTQSVLYALQFTHLVIAAFGVVFAYRLLARMHDARTGAFGAALVALATPIGLWATIPKRHVITATAVLFVAYLLYRSRTAGEGRDTLGYRAGAYATVGVLAWVHAPEALLLFLVLVAVDVPTATHKDLRTLGLLAGALFASLLPFFVTNYLVSGSPVKPPRMFSGGSLSSGGSGGSGGGFAGLLGPIQPLLAPLETIVGLMVDGLVDVVDSPGQLVTIFLRSGTVERVADRAHHVSVNLSILEASPILAAATGAIPVGLHRAREASGLPSIGAIAPARVVDLFLGSFAVLLSLLYMFRLPIHAQITVRYLFPIVPVLVVLIVRLPAIRLVARDQWRTLAWTVATAVLIGGQFLLVGLVTLDPGLGEAFQFHAVVSLAVAAPLALWAITGRAEGRGGQIGAVLLGLATAASILFLVFVTVEYYAIGDRQMLPIVRALGEAISIV